MARKDRIPVVFDTNLFVARLLRRKKNSINQRVFNLWLMRKNLQLVIGRSVLEEYLGTLSTLGALPQNLARLKIYLATANFFIPG